MPPEEQPQFQGQVVINLPQGFAPLAVPLSETRSINLSDVSSFETIKFDRLDEKGKPTGEQYDAPAIFRRGISEPLELNKEEAEIFKSYWNILLRNTQFLFQTMQQVIPPPAQPATEQQQLNP